MADLDGFSGSIETSEFSAYELLYMSHEGLMFYVEHMLGAEFSDPFDIIAALEEAYGAPIAQLLKETPM